MISRILLGLGLVCSASGQGLDPDRLAKIAPRIQAFGDEGTAPGFVN